MEAIAQAYLEKGDVSSALPILSTLALAAGSTAVQRRRRLLNARFHREANAVMKCVSGAPLTEDQRAAVCDAIMDRDLPTAVFFGPGAGVEATRRLQTLRLAVHPDKCKAANAAAAINGLHERRKTHDDVVALRTQQQAEEAEAGASLAKSATPQSTVASPVPPSSSQPGSPSSRRHGATSHGSPKPRTRPVMETTSMASSPSGLSMASPAGSPVSLRHTWKGKPTAATAAGNQFPPFSDSPLAATTGGMKLGSRNASPKAALSRTVPAGRGASKADGLRCLLAGFRANSNIHLESDLSFEGCASPDDSVDLPLPDAAVKHQHQPVLQSCDTADEHVALERILQTSVQQQFDRLRGGLLQQLRDHSAAVAAAAVLPAPGLDDALEQTLSGALEQSYSDASPIVPPVGEASSGTTRTAAGSDRIVRTHVTTKTRVAVPPAGMLPVLKPRKAS